MKTVETQFYTYDALTLKSGVRFGPVTLAYETYGTLNEKREATGYGPIAGGDRLL